MIGVQRCCERRLGVIAASHVSLPPILAFGLSTIFFHSLSLLLHSTAQHSTAQHSTALLVL